MIYGGLRWYIGDKIRPPSIEGLACKPRIVMVLCAHCFHCPAHKRLPQKQAAFFLKPVEINSGMDRAGSLSDLGKAPRH
jgi:hypothetical protein